MPHIIIIGNIMTNKEKKKLIYEITRNINDVARYQVMVHTKNCNQILELNLHTAERRLEDNLKLLLEITDDNSK